MADIRFTARFDGTATIESRIVRGSSRAEHILAIQVRNDTSPFVPMLTGSLDNRTIVSGNAVIYPGPSARYLYHGLLMVDPLTRSSFARYGATKVLTNKPLQFNKASHAQATDHWFDASRRRNLGKWRRVAAAALAREARR